MSLGQQSRFIEIFLLDPFLGDVNCDKVTKLASTSLGACMLV